MLAVLLELDASTCNDNYDMHSMCDKYIFLPIESLEIEHSITLKLFCEFN